eukprot:TRINITY_DN12170_c0_g1_i1.p1 TRINITY_DN12170_c0_g1~~TRINITY_DN12170_c0_g1_i1.p1  ORF type:complete len:120 (-),score=27.87 TRINITY_DN12170_c0_g1_i1:1-360(-)
MPSGSFKDEVAAQLVEGPMHASALTENINRNADFWCKRVAERKAVSKRKAPTEPHPEEVPEFVKRAKGLGLATQDFVKFIRGQELALEGADLQLVNKLAASLQQWVGALKELKPQRTEW